MAKRQLLCFMCLSCTFIVINCFPGRYQKNVITFLTTPSFDGNNEVFVAGGDVGEGVFNTIFVFELDSDRLKYKTEIKFPRVALASSVAHCNGNIYLLLENTTLFFFESKTRKILEDHYEVRPSHRPFFISNDISDCSDIGRINYVGIDVEAPNSIMLQSIRQYGRTSTSRVIEDLQILPSNSTMLLFFEFYFVNSKIYPLIRNRIGEDRFYKPANEVLIFNEDQRGTTTVERILLDFDVVGSPLQVGKVIVMFNRYYKAYYLDLQTRVVREVGRRWNEMQPKMQIYTMASLYLPEKKKIYNFICTSGGSECDIFYMDLGMRVGGNKTIEVDESQPAILDCGISGIFIYRIIWRRDGRHVQTGNETHNFNLTIYSMKPENEGEYECVGSTIFSKQHDEARNYITLHIKSKISNWTTPVRVTIGDNTTLPCTPTKHKSPVEIDWQRDEGRPIDSVVDFRFTKLEHGLRIAHLKESDGGRYTCIVTTKWGSLNASLVLIVENKTATKIDTAGGLEPEVVAGSGMLVTGGLIIISLLGICVLILSLYFLKYKKSFRLTQRELQEFTQGNTEFKPDNCAEEFTDGKPYDRSVELEPTTFLIQRHIILGNGEFGIVYKGVATINNKTVEVAFKTTRARKNDDKFRNQLKSLQAELKLMIHIGHHANVIKLIGAYTSELEKGVLHVGLEFCSNGSLERYLRESTFQEEGTASAPNTEGKVVPTVNHRMLLRWSLQISKGMEYIGLKKIIHSDLATRNILLAGDLSIRITDFGLSRRLENFSIYAKTGTEPLPWRWMAVESLELRHFSFASDVWSFGVTLWEMYSMGGTPYPGQVLTSDFISRLKIGDERLLQPDLAPNSIFGKMLECWTTESNNRPTFRQLSDFFQQLALATDRQRIGVNSYIG